MNLRAGAFLSTTLFDTVHSFVKTPLVDDVVLLIMFVTVLLGWFYVLSSFESVLQRQRARAWALAVLASAVFTAVSIIPTWDVLTRMPPGWQLFSFPSSISIAPDSPDALVVWMESETPLSRTCLLFFEAYMLVDLAVGSWLYPSELKLLEGWIHHVGYSAFFVVILANKWSNTVFAFAICELPTFLLALGSVFPRMRSDIAFGVTFLLTRILYCAYVFLFVGLYGQGVVRQVVSMAAFAAHTYWFLMWMKSMWRLRQDKVAKKV